MRCKLTRALSLFLALCLLAGSSLAVQGADAGDKGILRYALATARRAETGGEAANLIPRAKQALADAVADAETMLAKDDAMAGEVQGAYEALQEALWGLSYQRADKTALRNAIIRGEGIDLSNAPQGKADALRVAFEAASALAANDNLCTADQPLVAAVTANLLTALAALTGETPPPPPPVTGNGGAVTIPPKTPVSVDFKAYAKTVVPEGILAGYEDLEDGQWYAGSIGFTLAAKLMIGVSATEFAPQGTVDRASFAMILYRLSGSPKVEGFAGHWYSHAMQWAMGVGVTDGENPTAPITREQVVTMLCRFAGGKASSATLESFGDSKYISYWAKDAMVWALQNGIIRGDDAGNLNPRASLTRAELAAILERYIKGAANS